MTGIELKEAIEELEFVKDRFYSFPKETGIFNDIKNIQNAIKAINELEDYYAIGTVEECREARERQRGKKPEFELNLSDYTSRFVCECGKRIIVKHDSGVMNNHDAPNYCSNCGQRFDWSYTD